MGLYKTVLTPEQYASYMVIDSGDITDDQKRLIRRASEFIQQITWGNTTDGLAIHDEALMLAACAQVEYWSELGENPGIINSYSDEDTNTSYRSNNLTISPRARGYLEPLGLMFRGGVINANFISNSNYNQIEP
jgi:hypothetical protein